jgi:ubiquinone/menaquinone biosynthesis C-methylase UbiE
VTDVGTGDGLIAIGALDRLGPSGRVIFSDISADLLEHCRAAATEAGELSRCDFVAASADNLTGIADGSVDVVTARSVLIYVADKAGAFAEFRRVLRPDGRISIFEPINTLMQVRREPVQRVQRPPGGRIRCKGAGQIRRAPAARPGSDAGLRRSRSGPAGRAGWLRRGAT